MRFSGSGMGVFLGRDRYMTLAIFTQADPPIALEILVDEGRLVWPEVGGNKPAPDGWPTQHSARWYGMTPITYIVRTPVIRGMVLKGLVPPYHQSHGGTTPSP
jgi:hypothetical protein